MELGQGVYARVIANPTGEAVKIIDHAEISTAVREITILRQLSHPNIIRFISASFGPQQTEITMERYEMNLGKRIYTDPPISYHTVFHMMRSLVSAEAYLQSRGVIHADIKPANILVRGNDIALCDFGISVVTANKYLRGFVQTYVYRAPEIRNKNKLVYTNKVDIWSIGCIMYEMVARAYFTNHNPRDDDSSIHAIKAFDLPYSHTRKERINTLINMTNKLIKTKISTKLSQCKDYYIYYNTGFISLIAMCLHPNYNKRIDAYTLLCMLEIICNMPQTSKYLPDPIIKVVPSEKRTVTEALSHSVLGIFSETVCNYAQTIYDNVREEAEIIYDKMDVRMSCLFISSSLLSANMGNILSEFEGRTSLNEIHCFILKKINCGV